MTPTIKKWQNQSKQYNEQYTLDQTWVRNHWSHANMPGVQSKY